MTRSLDILLVDDSTTDRRLVRELIGPDHRVREEATAAAARRALDRAPLPDLALLDYRLPDADGVSLLPSFVKQGVPVVMLTGIDATEVIVQAMRAGAQDYLVKNHLSEESLHHALASAVEKERLRQAIALQQATLAEQAVALEAKNREVVALAGALTLAEQAERRRLADLLHDDLQQLIFGALLSVRLAELPDDHPSASHLATAEQALEQAIQATRDLAVSLTPPVLDSEELDLALRWLAEHMQHTCGLQVDVFTDEPCRLPSRALRVLLLQLARELLFNVAKHAGVSRAVIRLGTSDDTVTVAIEDEGRGFDAETQRLVSKREAVGGEGFRRGFGIYSVRERLGLLGGHLEITSAPERGSTVTIHVPKSVGTSDGE